MRSAIQSGPNAPARTSRRRSILLLCVIAWTVLVGLAIWWLLRGNAGPAVWVFQGSAAAEPGAVEQFHAMFRSDLGLQRTYPWILFGPYIALTAWLFPLERGRLRLSLPLNAAVCAAFVLASYALDQRTTTTGAKVVIIRSDQEPGATISAARTNRMMVVGASSSSGGGFAMADAGLTNLVPPFPRDFKPPLPSPWSSKLPLISILLDLLAYGAIIGLTHSVLFYRRFREREHRALFLESNLANARLDTLRAQLQPHFLFNSLNSIAALLRRDPRLAEATLTSLSELLRLALTQSEKQEVSLREETQFVERYLEIQQTRFGDRLRVERDIEPAALDCQVPALLLQPLVENAIRHGIEPRDSTGIVRLTAHRRDGQLALTVEDNGIGIADASIDAATGAHRLESSENDKSETAPARTPELRSIHSLCPSTRTGIGLANLRTRLETLYGARQKLELAGRPGGGVTVRIEMPWNPIPAPEVSGAFNRS